MTCLDDRVAPDILFLRVFCGPNGDHGNVLGVVRDGRAFPDEKSRQALARKPGYGRTGLRRGESLVLSCSDMTNRRLVEAG